MGVSNNVIVGLCTLIALSLCRMMTSKLHIDLAQVARGEDDKFALYAAFVPCRAGLNLTNRADFIGLLLG